MNGSDLGSARVGRAWRAWWALHRTTCGRGWRIASTLVAILVVQGLVCGLSLLPVVLAWAAFAEWASSSLVIRATAASLLLVPSYVAFALCLMVVSALVSRMTGAHTPVDKAMRLADLDWALMRWVQYLAATHLVRLFAGSLFRGSPIWTAYLRLNGARIGRRVYVNTLYISDHNLLELGDDVVIGGQVHLSGHTVEEGIVKTGRVRIGPRVTVGLGTAIGIDVVVGADCQVGALSVVPKHARLEPGTIYAGIPVHSIRRSAVQPSAHL